METDREMSQTEPAVPQEEQTLPNNSDTQLLNIKSTFPNTSEPPRRIPEFDIQIKYISPDGCIDGTQPITITVKRTDLIAAVKAKYVWPTDRAIPSLLGMWTVESVPLQTTLCWDTRYVPQIVLDSVERRALGSKHPLRLQDQWSLCHLPRIHQPYSLQCCWLSCTDQTDSGGGHQEQVCLWSAHRIGLGTIRRWDTTQNWVIGTRNGQKAMNGNSTPTSSNSIFGMVCDFLSSEIALDNKHEALIRGQNKSFHYKYVLEPSIQEKLVNILIVSSSPCMSPKWAITCSKYALCRVCWRNSVSTRWKASGMETLWNWMNTYVDGRLVDVYRALPTRSLSLKSNWNSIPKDFGLKLANKWPTPV